MVVSDAAGRHRERVLVDQSLPEVLDPRSLLSRRNPFH
jgi:hypothetical protein